MTLINQTLFLTLLISTIIAHSLLSYPRPTAAKACRLGGVPDRGGISLCPGPCDVRPLQPPFPVVTSPSKPAATFGRGEVVTIKYQRNNHGPGGFVRHSLVPVSQMMNKKVHARNSFHYGCWGANPVIANETERGTDALGFSLVGGDGNLLGGPPGYYVTSVTIPSVIPDGVYVLGWVWYGGMGGSLQNNSPKNPYDTGLFADYWSCSFVRIEGGRPLQAVYKPVFVNDLAHIWKEGCNAANDRPGVCVYEPCRVKGKLQKPAEFKNGKEPPVLTIRNFDEVGNRAGSSKLYRVPTPVPVETVLKGTMVALYECKEGSTQPKSVEGSFIEKGHMTD